MRVESSRVGMPQASFWPKLPRVSTVALVMLSLLVLTQAQGAEAGFWSAIGNGVKVASKAVAKGAEVAGKAIAKGTCVFVDRLIESAIYHGVRVQVDIPLGQACSCE